MLKVWYQQHVQLWMELSKKKKVNLYYSMLKQIIIIVIFSAVSYGITTGFGKFQNKTISKADLE